MQLLIVFRIKVVVYAMVATILFVRGLLLLLLILPISSSSLYTDQFHHYYLGLFVFVTGLIFRHIRCRNILIGIGLGLIVDEFMLPLYLTGLWDHEYWSLLGMLPMFILLFSVSLLFIVNSQQD